MEDCHRCRKCCWTEPLCSIHPLWVNQKNVHYHLIYVAKDNGVPSTCSPFCNFQIMEFSNKYLFFWLSEVDEISNLVCPPYTVATESCFWLCVWIFFKPPPPFFPPPFYLVAWCHFSLLFVSPTIRASPLTSPTATTTYTLLFLLVLVYLLIKSQINLSRIGSKIKKNGLCVL